MRLDLHTHIVPPRWEDYAARHGGGQWPRLVPRDACHATIMTGDRFFRDVTDQVWDPVRRIEDMDRLGLDVQALSPPPVMFCYWAEPKAAQAFARMQNEFVAAAVARHPGRFVGMATVPLQDPSLAIAELRHAREALGLRAVEIGSCPAGRDFDDAALFPFFQACRDLGMAVFVHPATPLAGGDRVTAQGLPLVVANPLETAVAISLLIWGGVLERLPDLRIAFAHGGGAFPFTLARLEHGWRIRAENARPIPRSPREYARRLYFDSLTLAPGNLRFLVGEFGAGQVMLGSDYPFRMGDPDPVGSLAAAGLEPEARAQIEGGTAARFLGL
jgi:aminocarboxymuconate-semialdehyde decarboxylase